MDTDTQSKFIPNSFQVVNAYVDHAMQYLTGDEFKVLIFTVRHIMGWQERIATRRAHISLSTYANGYAGMGGVGLSREKIVSALRELEAYKFLKRVKAKDGTYHKGTLWELCFNPDLTALEQRAAAKLDTNRKRIAKARKARASAIGLTDKTSLDTQTNIGLDTQTDIGLTDKTESNPLSKTTFKFAPAKADAQRSLTTDDVKAKKPKKERPRNPLFDAISLHLFGIPEGATVTQGARIGKVVTVCKAHGVIADDLSAFVAWYKREYPNVSPPRDAGKLEEHLIKWQAQRKAKASQSVGRGTTSSRNSRRCAHATVTQIRTTARRSRSAPNRSRRAYGASTKTNCRVWNGYGSFTNFIELDKPARSRAFSLCEVTQ